MRVLRISHSSVVDAWRGRERALRDRGVEVTLLSARRFDETGAVIDLVARPGEDVTGVATLGSHPALFLYDPRPIWRALAREWDVIDIHEEPFALATAEILLLRAVRRSRTPVVLYTAQNLAKRYPVPFRWLERWALSTASGISACNADAAAIVVAKGFPGKPRVIPLGIDPSTFRPAAGAGEHERPSLAASVAPSEPREMPAPAVQPGSGAESPSPVVVGLVGRLVPEKGVLDLLDALAGEPLLRARIVGSGPLASELPRRAASLGIEDRVDVLPAVSGDDIADFYRSIDVLAVPSLPTPRWTEQFGRVAIEAMAAGVPVVSSDAGALPEVIDGAGIVVPHGDPSSLASALMAAGGPRRAELRAAGLERAHRFSWAAVAADYLDLYESIVHVPSESARPVDIIVVAYGAVELLRRALEPVAAMSVTVVDNSSLSEIAVLCAELGVRYIDAGANRGFAAAVNIGLAHRADTTTDVLLLNPDARIEPDQIALLQHRLRADPDLASVAPAQFDGKGGSTRVEWPFPTPLNAWLEAVGLARLQHGPRFVIGSVLLLRAEAITEVGGFDERFFLYAEETDWAFRARRLGWRHRVVDEATAEHVGGGTSSDDRTRMIRFHASQERFYRKHFGAVGWQMARAGLWAGASVRSLVLTGERARRARRHASLLRLGPMRIEALSAERR